MEKPVNLEMPQVDGLQKTRTTAPKTRDLGPLHELLVRGLPDWLNETGALRAYDLAKYLGISYQALYAQFARKRVGPKRVNALIELSAKSKKLNPESPDYDEDFKALTYDDFANFFG
jgi:hypothetical protein